MNTHPLFVKVCGITRLQDANLAADLGASAIGFVFWLGSPRYVSPEDARDIVRRKAPGVKAVGVFVDEPPERVEQISVLAGLDLVQLHGSESPAVVRGLSAARPVIKAVALDNGSTLDLGGFAEDVLILLDAHDPARHGGTGRTIDWDAARRIALSRRIILAGGLCPENVGEAVSAVQPYGIDVSSGVESAPGVKDAARLKGFFEALHD
jgi:phosphoribosylanthranilate isomerase